MADNTTIPFFRYATSYLPYEEELFEIVRDVMARGAFVLQEDLRSFERNLAAFLGVGSALGVANGTDGLVLALRAVGVGPGDEVILPAHTYVATAAAVHFVGANPVLVECGTDHLIDPVAAEAAITPRTRAIIPVHLNGRTCEMDALLKLVESNDLLMVEDAAQAIGSRYRGRAAGSFGHAAAYSFYPAKVLGSLGDSGAVVTSDTLIAEKVSLLRDHGRDNDGVVVAWGMNSRLDNLQAAILDFKLERLHLDLERRRQIARKYDAALAEIDELVLPPSPDASTERYDVFQNYELESPRRSEFRAHLQAQGVTTIEQWGGRAVHQFPGLNLRADLPFTEAIMNRSFLLPMNVTLTDDEVDHICAAVRSFHGLPS